VQVDSLGTYGSESQIEDGVISATIETRHREPVCSPFFNLSNSTGLTTHSYSLEKMALDTAIITNLLTNGPHRQEVGRKQLTLAFAGLYIASTTLSAKPALVSETEKGYPRYYVPTESLHTDIKSYLGDSDSNGKTNGHKSSVGIETVETVKGKGDETQAVIERLTVRSRSMTWVRFLEGPLKGFIRFERSEIGRKTLPVLFLPQTHPS
jgi:hypothetical protein